MSMKAGTVADFGSSMAAAMEVALEREYQALKGQPLPDTGADDRRMLFAAIAQGVVRHLKDNLDSFNVSVVTHQTTSGGGAPRITSSGDGVSVQQNSGSGNLVKSLGDATIDQLDTSGVLY